MRKFIAITIGAMLSLCCWQSHAVDAVEIGEMFKKDRTGSTKEFKGKEMNVRGKVTAMRKETRGFSLILDNKVNVMIDKKTNAELIKEVQESIDTAKDLEDERVDKAKEWEKRYKLNYRKRGGRDQYGKRMEKYKDEMNPEGPADDNLQLEIDASGTCQGSRMGLVMIYPATSVTVFGAQDQGKAGKKGGKPAANNAELEAATKRTEWKLTGTIHVENGSRYFAPDPGQFGVDVWSFSLPTKVGNTAVSAALNGKRATIEATFTGEKRGTKAIKPGPAKVSSLKVQ